MRTITAANANRQFSKLLRDVQSGETVIVTSRGQAVARIEPIGRDESAKAERRTAWQKHLALLRDQPVLNLGPITRDEIYDD